MSDEYIIYGLVGFALTLWILYGIIKAATNSAEQTKLLKVQNKLLAHLLHQNGMDIDTANKLADPDPAETARKKRVEEYMNKQVAK